jgi:hypothetical protein
LPAAPVAEHQNEDRRQARIALIRKG